MSKKKPVTQKVYPEDVEEINDIIPGGNFQDRVKLLLTLFKKYENQNIAPDFVRASVQRPSLLTKHANIAALEADQE